MKTLGIGLAGARYGAHMHLANYATLPAGLVEVRGVCSSNQASADAFAREAGIPFATRDFDALLERPDIDVIDICLPPALHHEFAIRAAGAGKHIIMEKPLTGYFGQPGDRKPIGLHVPRSRMREGALANAEAVRAAVRAAGVAFCYAENWVYAPPIAKMRRLIKLALAIGCSSEGAVHSHVRRAVTEGITKEELRHVMLLALPTLGLPATAKALTWIDDIVGAE